ESEVARWRATGTCAITHGMKKMTIYLSDDLKKNVEAEARAEGCSAAKVIRDAIAAAVAGRQTPVPRIPLPGMSLGDPWVAERAGELLNSFGE
ncbi:MAG: CopG family transcriptional regulator, partial [bacterium]